MKQAPKPSRRLCGTALPFTLDSVPFHPLLWPWVFTGYDSFQVASDIICDRLEHNAPAVSALGSKGASSEEIARHWNDPPQFRGTVPVTQLDRPKSIALHQQFVVDPRLTKGANRRWR